MLGSGGKHLDECVEGDFIGIDYGIREDLSKYIKGDYKTFREKVSELLLEHDPSRSKIGIALRASIMWKFCKEIKNDDIVFSFNNKEKREYIIGQVSGDYCYKEGGVLPHRRPVKWFPQRIPKDSLSTELIRSSGARLTLINITKYIDELNSFIQNGEIKVDTSTVFALEKHLEDFLVNNWEKIDFGKDYDIYEDEAGESGIQFRTDIGIIDILAISKDKSTFAVIELKKGKTGDKTIGQIQSYMGYVKEEICTPDQKVRGMIVALECNDRLKSAHSMTNDIDLYTYEVDFKLRRGS